MTQWQLWFAQLVDGRGENFEVLKKKWAGRLKQDLDKDFLTI